MTTQIPEEFRHDQLVIDAAIGLDLETDQHIKALLQRLRGEAARSLNLLVDADLTDPDGVRLARQLQENVKRYRALANAVLELVQIGRNAEREANARDQEDPIQGGDISPI